MPPKRGTVLKKDFGKKVQPSDLAAANKKWQEGLPPPLATEEDSNTTASSTTTAPRGILKKVSFEETIKYIDPSVLGPGYGDDENKYDVDQPLSHADQMIVRRRTQSEAIRKNASWLTSSKFFQRFIDRSFAIVDADGSGDVTLDELYAGLLLVHLRLAYYVGSPACRVSDRG